MNENGNSNKLWKRILKHFMDSFLVGVVFAVISSLLITHIQENIQINREIRKQESNLSNIYIGCNKSWVDENFGTPQFIHIKDGYLVCAYISEYYALQIAFDEAESACAYLVTALKIDDNFKIKIDDFTFADRKNFSNLVLGEFTYYDFPEKPMSVWGFVTNGSGRYMYSERYYFISNGGYYDYYLASLDYGTCLENAEFAFFDEREDIDDEVSAEMISGLQLTNRSEACPNSYGVSDVDSETFDKLLLNYSWFNSQQLRNKYHY